MIPEQAGHIQYIILMKAINSLNMRSCATIRSRGALLAGVLQ